MSYEVLARKYRPSSFEEVVGQDHVIQALSNSIHQDRIHQAFIFSGTRGVGKTTLGRILAKCLNCTSSDKPVAVPCNECVNCKEIKLGTKVNHIMRHTVGLYHGQIGSKEWKRYLSDNLMARESDFQKTKHIMTIVQNNEKANQANT